MRFFVFFGPNFQDWPLVLAQEIHDGDSAHSFFGIVHGSKKVFQRVERWTTPRIRPVVHLDALERRWLETPCDESKLRRYEALLGPGELRRIITADRQIGIGLVSGAVPPRTRLMELARDGEMIRRYVVGLLDHLFELFERDRPDLVLTHVVAGAVAMTLARACRHFGIPFIRFAHTRIADRWMLDEDAESRLLPVRRAFERALVDPSVLAQEIPRAREFLRSFRERPAMLPYAVWANDQYLASFSPGEILRASKKDLREFRKSGYRSIVKYLRVVTPKTKFKERLRTAWRVRRLVRGGRFRHSSPPSERPFAYYPLHYDPESSTQVLAPMHTDQLAVIEALVKSLPLSMDLVVKEHVTMLGKRPRGYYERIVGMPNVVMVSPFEDSVELIRRSDLVAVITGSAGWEAMMLGRPTLVIGDLPALCIGEGALHCPDLSRLPAVIPEALAMKPADDRKLELFLAALFHCSFDLHVEHFEGGGTEKSVRQHPELVRRLADQLVELAQSPPS